MGTGQTLQEGGWLDFYALTLLHAATVPGMRWYNHQMERYMDGLLCIKVPSLLGLDTQDGIPLQLKMKIFLDLGKYDII